MASISYYPRSSQHRQLSLPNHPHRTSHNDNKNQSNTSTRKLSEVLDVHPQDATCIGFAPSQNRGCRNRTRADNRARAERILRGGTDILHAGESLDGPLASLAPLLLCYLHKNQASGIVEEWQEEVSQHRSSISQQRVEDQRSNDELRQLDDDELHRLIAGVTAALQARRQPQPQPQRTDARPPTTSRTAIPQLQRSGLSSPRARSPFTAPTTQVSGPVVRREEHRERENSNPPQSRTEPAQTQQAPTTTLLSAGGTRPTTTASQPESRLFLSPFTSSPFANPPFTFIANTPRTSSLQRPVTRKPIEADCGICMHPFVEDGEDTDDGPDGGRSSSSSSSSSQQPELVWCRAQCGGNLHKACFSRWETECLTGGLGLSRRVVTCPLCRADWKNEEEE
ncbi:hypothetical protein EMPG_14300 [Blastomyces silverae]|uniref:RING-type domain-containing protein n=1 Tax=Blastomyces silverae TaxID=2060906 RepID=A0A0H1BFT2_9EURO|nr:hypothetical protein EMPG_14300 [Blastomyces silverae]